MGVPGLWERLDEASSGDVSLANMAWTTYNPKRPDKMLRIGVDASIWLVQTATVALPQYPHHALQILFHKLAKLLPLPVRLLFVFDGADRPNFKRGKRISGARAIGEERNFRKMIEAFGYEHWTAPGEAEAELGYLSHIGSLDLVISEDVDSLIFRAKRLLLRTKLESTKGDGLRFKVFYKDDIEAKLEVDESALILVALMSGGDYDETGLMRCGPKVSFALGQAGHGRTLVSAYKTQPRAEFVDDFLPAFREMVADTLRRNPDNILGKRFMKLADSITDAFPDLDVLDYYVNPLTSASRCIKWGGFASVVGRPDVSRLAQLMQAWQEWDEGDILNRFRSTVWEGVLSRSLLEELVQPGVWDLRCRGKLIDPNLGAVLAGSGPSASTSAARITDFFAGSKRLPADASSSIKPGPSSSTAVRATPVPASVPLFASCHALVTAVSRYRKHASTDELLEYRVTIDPAAFVQEVQSAGLAKDVAKPYDSPSGSDSASGANDGSGSEGLIPSSSQAGKKRTPADPSEPCLFWVPYKVLKASHPDLVAGFNAREEAKLRMKQEKLQRAEDRANGIVRPRKSSTKEPADGARRTAPVQGKGKARALSTDSDLSDDSGVFAARLKHNLATRSKPVGRSVSPASSASSFPDLSPAVTLKPQPKPKSKKPPSKPAYVELSDSDEDIQPGKSGAVVTPKPLPIAPPEAAATVKKPTRRRAVSDSPPAAASVDEAVCVGDGSTSTSGSGNPSPKKSPRKSRTLHQRQSPPRRARADLSSDDDTDDEHFPADPFAADKARRAAALGGSKAVPATLNDAEATRSLSSDWSPQKPPGSQTFLSSPLKRLDLLAPATKPKPASTTTTVPSGSDKSNVIEIGSSPPPMPKARARSDRSTTTEGEGGGGKGQTKKGVIGRKGSNPWSKARRAGSATASAEDEVIDLTDD